MVLFILDNYLNSSNAILLLLILLSIWFSPRWSVLVYFSVSIIVFVLRWHLLDREKRLERKREREINARNKSDTGVEESRRNERKKRGKNDRAKAFDDGIVERYVERAIQLFVLLFQVPVIRCSSCDSSLFFRFVNCSPFSFFSFTFFQRFVLIRAPTVDGIEFNLVKYKSK